MGRICNVTVKYGRTTKPADYEAKRADVELTGIVDEGEDEQAAIDRLSTMSISKVHELLGLAAPAKNARAAAVPAQPSKADLEAAAKAAAGVPAAESKKAAAKPPKIPPAPPPAAPAADPAAVVDELADLTGDAPAPPAKEIPDTDIVSAITKKNQALKDGGCTTGAQMIRALIGEFIAPPGQARQIEQGKRAAFLAKLEALKPA